MRIDCLANWTPKQRESVRAADNHRYVLYGGSRGPGKSYWLRWSLLRFLVRTFHDWHLRGVRVGLFCEDYPVLRDRQISKIKAEFAEFGDIRENKTDGLGFFLKESDGGGMIALRNLDDPSKYKSSEFAAIGVDQLEQNSRETFDILRGSLRWPGIEGTRFLAACNPGGIGHLWVKQLWVDRQFPPELADKANEFIFVRALPADNPHLAQSYWDELNSLPNSLRRAWVDGDWNVFAGQAFGEWRADVHVIKPFEIPAHWPRWRAVDWGFAQPMCCLWLTHNPDDFRHYVYRELYGTGWTDREQARRIKEMTSSAEHIRWTLADPSMWTQKSHEGLTFSTADEYRAEGVVLTPADNNRLNGIRRVREMLRVVDGKPGLRVFETCTNLIRTLPALPYSQVHVEDVDTKTEDHAYDAARYGVMRAPQKPGRVQVQEDVYAFLG